MKRKNEEDYIDPEFCRLLLRILDFKAHLSGREIKYLLWKYYYGLTDEEIAKLEGNRVSKSGINLVLNNAYRKIRHDF